MQTCLLLCALLVACTSARSLSARPDVEGLSYHHQQVVDEPLHPLVLEWIESRKMESKSGIRERQLPAGVDIDQVINIAKSVWNIIEGGRPTLNTSFDYATAVPSGVTEWTELEYWADPVTASYSAWVENIFKVKILELNYTVIAMPMGQYQGKGQYLTNVGIIPTIVRAPWSYTLSASTNVHGIVNVGSKDSPIAALQIDLNWGASWMFKKFTKTEAYYVRGDGKPITSLNSQK
ncbi:hypothetical protein PROFUN_00084 [Planoprotostelium fungivorum]|uniref:Uncharacterized protein n=1 Tax=Planoprotostelium fungivorum TaxID=1890364 RepID=A0A2P6P0K8_9EUKA|nr:hypothetical protein PROFUN_00084 [Planoprotostelium fungivorum]